MSLIHPLWNVRRFREGDEENLALRCLYIYIFFSDRGMRENWSWATQQKEAESVKASFIYFFSRLADPPSSVFLCCNTHEHNASRQSSSAGLPVLKCLRKQEETRTSARILSSFQSVPQWPKSVSRIAIRRWPQRRSQSPGPPVIRKRTMETRLKSRFSKRLRWIAGQEVYKLLRRDAAKLYASVPLKPWIGVTPFPTPLRKFFLVFRRRKSRKLLMGLTFKRATEVLRDWNSNPLEILYDACWFLFTDQQLKEGGPDRRLPKQEPPTEAGEQDRARRVVRYSASNAVEAATLVSD